MQEGESGGAGEETEKREAEGRDGGERTRTAERGDRKETSTVPWGTRVAS